MKSEIQTDCELTVQSFAYTARQLAGTLPAGQEQILSEAERHCCALRLLYRDMLERAEVELRRHLLSTSEFQRSRETAAQAIAQAQQAIGRIAARHASHRLAA